MFTKEIVDKLVTVLTQAGVSEDTCNKAREEMMAKVDHPDKESEMEDKSETPEMEKSEEKPAATVKVVKVQSSSNPLAELLKGSY